MPVLKRASKNRPGGPWSDDDYDVFDGKQHIGASCGRTPRQKIVASSSLSRRACRSTHMIAVTLRAVSKR